MVAGSGCESVAQDYVGPYRIINLIRAGKSCEVYDVANDTTGERLAIKLLTGDAARNKEEVGFIKHEFEVGRALEHPQVIRIYNFDRDRDSAYLVMELFQAPNLKQRIVQGVEPLAPLAAKCVRQAAEGLAYFHSKGWVHRDIKPDNFLMNDTGDVKLIDFALAVKRKGGLARLFSTKSKIQGTRSYMSPEQIRGQTVDERSDIYSFACTMHELLTGKPPYTGVSTQDLLTKHLRSPVPPVQAGNRNVTDEFGALLKASLAKKPEDRPQTMNDFLTEMANRPIFKIPPKVQKPAAGPG